MTIDAQIDVITKSIQINQKVVFTSTSDIKTNELYLYDWNNSYSSRKTPLGVVFAEEFNNRFTFAKTKERGFTHVLSITDNNNGDLLFNYVENHPDVIRVQLK